MQIHPAHPVLGFVLCIAVLAVTGYLIGSPLAIQLGSEASYSYWFGTVRFVHFVAAFVFFFNFAFRILWGFVGNKYADWRIFILYRKQQIEEIKDVLAVDILQARAKPLESIGHNALAGLTYFISFLAFLFQCGPAGPQVRFSQHPSLVSFQVAPGSG